MKITDSQLYKYVPKAEKLWLSWLPTDEEIPEHIFSKRFERKMKRLIRNQRRTPRIRKICVQEFPHPSAASSTTTFLL